MITYNKHRCIIKDNGKLQSMINKEIERRDVTARSIVKMANLNGLKINEQALSRYRKHGNVKGALSSSDVLWVCELLKINLVLTPKKSK